VTDAEAKAKWCPFALTSGETAQSDITLKTKDYDRGDGAVGDAVMTLTGTSISIPVVNRTSAGEPHLGCMCITTQCHHWTLHPGTSEGFCTALDNNRRI